MKVFRIKVWTANAGLVVLTVSLVLLSGGMKAADFGAAAGSVITLAALAMFMYVVFSTSCAEAEGKGQ